jgi:hypothetical protein
MIKLSEELLANPGNPRQISSRKLDLLKRSMADLGDCSQITKNVHPDVGGYLVCGHQRAEILKQDPNAEVIITKHYAEPTRTGTVAEGFILSCGESFGYREVHWDENRAHLGALVGNNHAGVYDEDQLINWVQQLQEADIDLDMTLFDSDEWACLLPEEMDEVVKETDEIVPSPPAGTEALKPAAKPEPAREPMPPLPPGAQVKQVQLFYAERDHAEFLRMVGVIQAKFCHENISEAVMEAVQQTSEA